MQTAKSEYITERYIKDVLNDEDINENEFYAEQEAEIYSSDLKSQFMDNDLQQSKRLKVYNAEKFDLNLEMKELDSIKTFITDNTFYFRDNQSEILKFIDSKITEICDRLEIVDSELSYITTRLNIDEVF
jgi:hypothetical protein